MASLVSGVAVAVLWFTGRCNSRGEGGNGRKGFEISNISVRKAR